MTKGMVTNLGAAALLALASFGCGSNNPSTNTEPVGGSTTPATSAAGGNTAITTVPASSAPEGGNTTANTSTAAGGNTGTGTTGTKATGGTTSAGGTTATPTGGSTASTGTGDFSPLCAGLVTAGGAVPSKGVNCTDADPAVCYKTCGPSSMGYKSETCSGGAYVESKTCSFPAGDYSCYKVPAVISSACPTTTPKSGEVCTVAECTPCADADGNYSDSGGSTKAGYCVCPKPKTEGGTSKWTCASKDAWPCPSATGC